MSTRIDMQNADAVIDLLLGAAETLSAGAYRRGSLVALPASGRLLVSGDLHDNPIHFEKIRRLARLDESPDHHVVFQEMVHTEHLINGVDLSHRMLIRIAQQVIAFPRQVHPLLANHELSQMTGAGVSKGAGNSVELFDAGLEFVYHDRAPDVTDAIKHFVRAMPLALRSDSGVFCAHSLPAPAMMTFFDHRVLERELRDEDYKGPEGAAYLMTWGRRHTKEQIDALAAQWEVRIFFLGHEHIETGCEMLGPKLVKLNSDHEHGAVIVIDLADPPTAEEAMMGAIRLNTVSY